MVHIPEELIDRVRSQANIVEIVNEYAPLKKSGQNYFAHCPFHEDNTPSLSVSDQKQIYKCFSCKRGGNVFGFIQEIERLTFPEAVFKVAELANVDIDIQLKQHVLHQEVSHDSKAHQLIAIHESVADFYHHLLMNSEIGQQAYRYLVEERQLSPALLETFQIGFSPKERDYTQLMLKEKDNLKVTGELLAESGIFSAKQSVDDAWKDRFSSRIMFPIRNAKGETVAFSGRIFSDESQSGNYQPAKYLNSPETYLFNKRKCLFNYDKARMAIRKTKEVILFEGFMDVISSWGAGIENGVASMGTSFTKEQVQHISRDADTVVIAYDGDDAGIESTKRIIDFLDQTSQLTIEVASFPRGLDPDEFIQQRGKEAFVQFMLNGRDARFAFLMRYWKRQFNLNNESEQVKYVEQMAVEIAKLTSPIERDVYIKELAETFKISYDSIDHQVQALKIRQHKSDQQQRKYTNNYKSSYEHEKTRVYHDSTSKTQVERAEEALLSRLFYHPETWTILEQIAPEFEFAHAYYQHLFLLYEAFKEEHKAIDVFMDQLSDTHLKQIVSNIAWDSLSSYPTVQEIKDYVDIIQYIYPIQEQLEQKKQEMKQARKSGDKNKELSLSIEVINLNRQLKN